jgi:hypothetical protein
MRRVLLTVAVLVAALSHATPSTAQELPSGGYYADGAYYVPNALTTSTAPGVTSTVSTVCPPGYGYPTVYVAYTATAVRIQWISLVGGDAPGFPYVPVSASQVPC